MPAFLVNIRETYARSVIIYADTEQEAEEIADELCDDETIDMTRHGYDGRDIYAQAADESEIDLFEVYALEDEDEEEDADEN